MAKELQLIEYVKRNIFTTSTARLFTSAFLSCCLLHSAIVIAETAPAGSIQAQPAAPASPSGGSPQLNTSPALPSAFPFAPATPATPAPPGGQPTPPLTAAPPVAQNPGAVAPAAATAQGTVNQAVVPLPVEALSAVETEFNVVSEQLNKASGTVMGKLRLFGHDFFQGHYQQRDISAIGPDYLLAPGDQLEITFWGDINKVISAQVSAGGYLAFPNVGTIQVAGLSLSACEKKLSKTFSTQFTNFQLKVAISSISFNRVFLVGEAKRIGSYSLSSLNTLTDFLLENGGVLSSGSVRDIQILRNGKVAARFDLYDLITKGDRSKDIRLQTGDVVRIPPAGPRVAIGGEVMNPGIYELKGGERAIDLLEMAGGATASAYLKRALLSRIVPNKEMVIQDVNLDSALKNRASSDNALLRDRDVVIVQTINHNIANEVAIAGNVERPGQYEFTPGLKVKDLLQKANGVLPGTYLERAEVIRFLGPTSNETIPFKLGALIAGDESQNIELKARDNVKIFLEHEIFSRRYGVQADILNGVTLVGNVEFPGTYQFKPNMRLKDLLDLGKSILPGTYLERGEIIRYTDPNNNSIIPFSLGALLKGDANQNMALEKWDEVRIYSKHNLVNPGTVFISGEVKKPGRYDLKPGMRISDLVFTAGGLSDGAYLMEGSLTRTDIQKDKFSTSQMIFNVENSMLMNDKDNLALQKYDSLVIRKIPDLKLGKAIELLGEVRFPGIYTIVPGDTLAAVIERAGGLTGEAFIDGAVFTRLTTKSAESLLGKKMERIQFENFFARQPPDMRGVTSGDAELYKQVTQNYKDMLLWLEKQAPTGRLFFHLGPEEARDLALEDGDALFIPARPSHVFVLGNVYNAGGVLYKDDWDVDDYLSWVGGPTAAADKSNLHIIRPNGQVIREGLFSVDIKPGDAIIVPADVETKVSARQIFMDVLESLFKIATIAATIKVLGQ